MSRFARYDPDGASQPKLDSTADLVLRAPDEGDVDSLARLAADREGGQFDDHRRRMIKAVEASLHSPERLFLVAEYEGALVGYGKARYHRPAEGDPPNAAPEGWYLTGLIVRESFRRRGIGAALTRARLAWVASRARSAYYFANDTNRASIDLHASFGFEELTRDFVYPRLTFEGGQGVLYRARFDSSGDATYPHSAKSP